MKASIKSSRGIPAAAALCMYAEDREWQHGGSSRNGCLELIEVEKNNTFEAQADDLLLLEAIAEEIKKMNLDVCRMPIGSRLMH